MNITISGASGFIGSRLQTALAGHTIRTVGHRTGGWDPAALRDADAVIHLAGEPVAQRWTPAAKQRILESRVLGTRRLVEILAGLPKRPQTLVCSSAIGYYGSRGDEILTESSTPGKGFLAEVCIAWEKEARAAEALGTRVVMVRTGLVLDPKGGALQRMLPAFRMGAGGRIGSGRQWMSWIHIQDLVSLMSFALDHPLRGPVNGVAPGTRDELRFHTRTGGRPAPPRYFPDAIGSYCSFCSARCRRCCWPARECSRVKPNPPASPSAIPR